MTSCLSPPSSPSPSTNRQHKIQRKPLAPGFTLQIPTSPSPSTSSSLLHHHYHLGPESPRLLSSPEPQSSPCTSDFLTSSGSDDDDEDDEEERFRRGMPSRHSSLRVGGLNPSINFARPFPSYTTKKVALNSDLDEKEHLEERCARMSLITDPGVVSESSPSRLLFFPSTIADSHSDPFFFRTHLRSLHPANQAFHRLVRPRRRRPRCLPLVSPL